LPASIIRDDLANGTLVHLDLQAYEQGEYPIYAIRRIANPPGPAASWMIEAFHKLLSNCPNHADFTAALGEIAASEMPLAAE
jgi:DNA-binding transcriptional LysR family regulator